MNLCLGGLVRVTHVLDVGLEVLADLIRFTPKLVNQVHKLRTQLIMARGVAEQDRVTNPLQLRRDVFPTVGITQVVEVRRWWISGWLPDDVAPCHRTVIEVQCFQHLLQGVHRPRELTTHTLVSHEQISTCRLVDDVDHRCHIKTGTDSGFLIRLNDQVLSVRRQDLSRDRVYNLDTVDVERAVVSYKRPARVGSDRVRLINDQVRTRLTRKVKRVFEQKRFGTHPQAPEGVGRMQWLSLQEILQHVDIAWVIGFVSHSDFLHGFL